MLASSGDLGGRKWLDIPVTKQGKIKKQKSSARLKWPIFDEMAKIETDSFWEDYWIRASKGKFPTGFSFNGNELFYSYRNKISKAIFGDNIEDMCQLARHMYQDYSGLFSPLDLKHINQRRELILSTNEITTWSKCNPSQKSNLITYYLIELAKEYGLDTKGKNELEQTLWVGINVGAFNEKRIEIDNNKIIDIIGLEWDPEKERFYIDCEQAPHKIKKPSKNSSKQNDPYCLYSYWIKLNASKSSIKDEITEIGLDDIDTSIPTSYIREEDE